MTNNSSTNKKKERALQEATILQDFMRTTQRRVELIRIQGSDSLDLSPGEKKVLQQVQNAGMVQGIAAGVVSFVLLRRGPQYWKRFVSRRSASSSSSSGGYKLDVPDKAKSPFSSGPQDIPPPPPPTAGRPLMRALGFTVDLALSFVVAAYTSFYAADREALAKSVVELPLMEGRSALSDHFCSDLVKEYQRQLEMSSDKSGTTNDDDDDMTKPKRSTSTVPPFDRKALLKKSRNDLHNPILKAYLEFINNCQKRHAMEQRIRQEQGLSSQEPVEIPSPGVTISDEEEAHLDFDTTSSASNGYDFSDDFSKDDANSFVADQDDDNNNNNK